jgi:hypothetical protein
MFEIAAFLFWLIVIVGLLVIIFITPVYTSHIAQAGPGRPGAADHSGADYGGMNDDRPADPSRP